MDYKQTSALGPFYTDIWFCVIAMHGSKYKIIDYHVLSILKDIRLVL